MKTIAANKISSFNKRIHRREGVMIVDYSPKTVGAYRIRPDVGEDENNSGKGICK